MIAYNHYIKFIPELKNDKKLDGSFTDVILVKENKNIDLNDQIKYEMTFFNNQGRDLTLFTDREFASTTKGQIWAFEVKGVVTFFWHSGTLSLEYIQHGNFTEELLEYWCLHIILPLFFTLEETFDFLHAGAVEIEGEPILFVADSFGGKSTMTDYFMKQEHTMVSDDKVATYEKDGQIFSVSSHPHHRPYRKMEDKGYFVKDFSFTPKPIHCIYKLEKAEKDSAIVITELKGLEKFKSLRHASETNLFFQKVKRFEHLMRMAKSIQVFKIVVPWDIGRLNQVYEAIIRHSKIIKKDNHR